MTAIKKGKNRSGAALMGALMALVMLSTLGCNRETRNILFDTPKKYEKMGLPVVHLYGDSTKPKEAYNHRISTDDRLQIRFMNDIEFASGLKSASQTGNSGIVFVVDQDGNVNLPLLGNVNVLGKTREDVQKMLLEGYGKSFTNPSIEVLILGLSVSVQGEVANPGIYELPREKTTLVEVLADAGGITAYGKQRVVKVIRGVGVEERPEIFIFDLTQLDAIQTTDMILRDKDVVYVQPRGVRIFANAIAPYSTFLSLLSSVGSIAVITYSIILNRN